MSSSSEIFPAASPVDKSPIVSPSKRKLPSSPKPSEGSPTKKSLKMENIQGESILKELTGNQLITTGTEPLKNVDQAKPQERLLFKKMSENAFDPVKGSKMAAGFDLKSAYDCIVPKRGSCLVKTDIQIQLPSGTYGRVAPRSGLALKHKLDVGAGVIDEDYRGNVGVILFNHSDEDFPVTKGDRIAQLICEKICYPEALEVETLDDSERGSGGFGSTG